MKPEFRNLMNHAARLTRAGSLQAATAAIQGALRRLAVPAPHQTGEHGIDRVDGDFIDADTARFLPESSPATTKAPQPDKADSPAATPDAPHAAAHPQGQFLEGSYGSGTSQRDYKLFVPSGAGGAPVPLVVMLHGCTQNPDDFAAGTAMNELAQAQGFVVLYPAQSPRANPQRCWNWFKHSHQVRGRGEPALLAGMVRDVMAQHAIAPERVYVAGLSAGGAMAAILGQAYPELFAAVGVHSGLAAGAAGDIASAMLAMRNGGTPPNAAPTGMPTIVFHGDADSTVNPRNGQHIIAASAGPASLVETEARKTAGGHAVTRSIYRTAQGDAVAEHWLVQGGAHAWSGGRAAGTYTDARGPDASAEMLRFFLQHPHQRAH